MALAFGQHEIGVKRTGRTTAIPDKDIVKLMYYLNCVCTTIECNDELEIRRFKNYSNWHNVSTTTIFILLYIKS